MADVLRDLMMGVAKQNTPVQAGEAVSQYTEPMLLKLQELYNALFGPQSDPNAGLVHDPIGGGPMSRQPLRQRMVGKPYQDPSMGMGY